MTDSHRDEPMTATSVLLTMMTVVLWAGTPVAIRYSTDLLPPVATAGLRFSLAAIFMLAWATVHGTSLKIPLRDLARPAVCGVLLFLQIGTFTHGVYKSNASHGTVFINTFVLWIVVIDHFVLKGDRLSYRKFGGVVIAGAGAGVMLLTTGQVDTTELLEAASLEGDCFLLLSALLLGIKISYTKHSVKSVHPDSFIFWHDVFGVILFAAYAFLIEGFEPGVLADFNDEIVRNAIWGLAYQGLAVAGLCFAVQARLLKKHSASQLSVFSFSTPLFGILFAVLLRGDPISPWLFVAGACVAVGIFLVNSSRESETEKG